MKAPAEAYMSENGNFVTEVARQGNDHICHYVARFLRGTESEGGYSENPATMIERIKELFHLDALQIVRKGDKTGFIGMVKKNSRNYQYHNVGEDNAASPSRRGAVANGHEDPGNFGIYLNDAGLNVRPDGSVNILSSFANAIYVQLVLKGAFYEGLEAFAWKMKKGNSVISAADYPSFKVAERETALMYAAFYDDSGTGNPVTDENNSIDISLNVTNSEGTATIRRTIVAAQRVVWLRPEYWYTENTPDYLEDIAYTTPKAIDIYEKDLEKIKMLTDQDVPTAGNEAYAYQATETWYPTMLLKARRGWYYAEKLNSLLDFDEDPFQPGKPAWHVDDTGRITHYKMLVNRPQTIIVCSAYLETESAPAGQPQTNLTRKLTMRFTMQKWLQESDVKSVTIIIGRESIIINGQPAYIARNPIVMYDTSMTNTIDFDFGGFSLPPQTITFTKDNLVVEKTYTQLYRSRQAMIMYSGSRYLDSKDASRMRMRMENHELYQNMQDGTQREYEGQVQVNFPIYSVNSVTIM